MNEKEDLHVEYNKEKGKLNRSNNMTDNLINSTEFWNDSDKPSGNSCPSYKWYHINVDFLPVKAGHFFDCAKKIGYLPFQVLFLTSFGLTNIESGLILGLR